MLYSVIVYLLALLLCPTALVAKPSSIHLHSTVINTGPDTTGSPEHHDHRVITNPSFSIAEAIARDDRVAARPYFEELQQVLDAPLPQQPAVQDLIDYGYLWPCTSKNSSLSPSEQSIRPAEPRTLFFLFDGTDADCSKEDKKSVICELSELLKHNPDYHINYKRGIGTGSSVGESWWNAATGLGLDDILVDSYKYLVDNYRDGDIIIVAGWSRGAFTGRKFCDMVDSMGIQNPRSTLASWGLGKKHTVEIALLVSIDTVDSTGIPKTGPFFSWRRISQLWKGKGVLEPGTASNVKDHRQLLALHEDRKAFTPILMHAFEDNMKDKSLQQVWVPGTHGSIGWDGPDADVTLTWISQQFHDHSVELDTEALDHRFCLYKRDHIAPNNIQNARYPFQNPIEKPKIDAMKALGVNARIPRGYEIPGMVTNEEIHAIVRLRGYGLKAKDPAVRGYELQRDEDGFFYREYEAAFAARKKGNPLAERRELREAQLGKFEADLLGQAFE